MDHEKMEIHDISEAKDKFPFLTVLATLLTLFLFMMLMLLAYYTPYARHNDELLSDKTDYETKLSEIRAKNQAILEGRPGTDTRLSLQAAMDELMSKLHSEKDVLPFPKPPPPPVNTTKGSK
jgi:hypothetical protein